MVPKKLKKGIDSMKLSLENLVGVIFYGIDFGLTSSTFVKAVKLNSSSFANLKADQTRILYILISSCIWMKSIHFLKLQDLN